MKYLSIRLIRNRKEFGEVRKVRDIVFVNEQKVPRELEWDVHDKTSKHIIVIYKGKTIGCARITFKKRKAKLERIALFKKYRGKGFGKEIVKYMVGYSKMRKVKEIMMHSQYHLIDFYSKLGFKQRGKTFREAGIKHIEMYLEEY